MERRVGPAKPVIFISYSHKDEPESSGESDVQWLSYVQSFLAPAVKHGVIEVWADPEIRGGGDWEAEIEAKLAACDVFILLASRHSMASDYVIDKEIAAITERQNKGESVQFYPIVLTPIPKAGLAKIKRFNLRPRDGNPLSGYARHDRDAHMAEIADEIAELVETMSAERPSDATASIVSETAILHKEIRPIENFVGRDAQMAAIGDALAKGAEAAITQPAAVHGLGGIGKSTLARQFAWDRRADYAGIWWLDAEKSKDSETWDGIERGLVALHAELSPGTEEPQDRAQAARDTMAALSRLGAEAPWLLIYDNVDDFLVTDHGNWPAPEIVQVLITSRIRNWRGNVAEVEVTEWDMPDAIRYLQSEGGRDDLTEADARVVAETLGRHPLALSHAAAYLLRHAAVTTQTYITNLTRRMNEAPKGAEYPRSVFATFQAALDDGEAEAVGARAALSLAAFFAPDDIPEDLFQQDAEHYPDDLRPPPPLADRFRSPRPHLFGPPPGPASRPRRRRRRRSRLGRPRGRGRQRGVSPCRVRQLVPVRATTGPCPRGRRPRPRRSRPPPGPSAQPGRFLSQ